MLESYQSLKSTCREQILALFDVMQQEHLDKAKIFTAHIDILEDEVINEEIVTLIESERVCADWAIYTVYENYIQILSKAKNQLSRERSDDLKDVRNRLLRIWAGVSNQGLSVLSHPVIVVAHDLLPSDTASMDKENVLAIVTEVGGYTSHSAIIARGFGIPAVLGVADITTIISNDELIAVNGIDGNVIVGPFTDKLLKEYEQMRTAFLSAKKKQQTYLVSKAATSDGHCIDIGLNVGSDLKAETQNSSYVDFVGLFRTEFLYMLSSSLPCEEMQFNIYKELVESFNGKPVTLRTLDIGGDKDLPALPIQKEENPFLGKRALRLCFDEPEMFKTQLRAALRASKCGPLWLMFPMVGSMEDLRRAKAFLHEAMTELDSAGIQYDPNIKVGVMIEIPAIALMAPELVREVDFASFGTNDLCQYTLATDRGNPNISEYYQDYHPALFRLINLVAKTFIKAEKPLCVCGELGGQVLAAPVLVGLGINKLSMAFSSVAAVKQAFASYSLKEMQEMSEHVLRCDTQEAILNYLNNGQKNNRPL